jgi:hypothetical protein
LDAGTWFVWASGEYGKEGGGVPLYIRLYLQTVASGETFNRVDLSANTSSTVNDHIYTLHAVTTLSSSGTVRMSFSSSGTFTTSIYACVMKCIRIR